MDVCHADCSISSIAAAIGEPARARMLQHLLDGHAHTSTELAIVAEVSPSTASAHLNTLKRRGLVKMFAQGKHRYYSLGGREVAAALEALSVLAGTSRGKFAPSTPVHLRAARTCYDHIAGALGVALHDRAWKLGWFTQASAKGQAYELTAEGEIGFTHLGVDIGEAHALRRRFAYGCLDWSERRPHLGGALGAALLRVALQQRWVLRELDSRALEVTRRGKNELQTRFGLRV